MNDLDRELDVVKRQEDELQFAGFSAREALDIGLGLLDLANEKKVSVEVDIEREGHCLFHHAMDGTSRENSDWIQRKQNTMRLAGKSSYLVYLELARSGSTFESVYGKREEGFAVCGGGFPVRIRGRGIVGSIVVSGLPHELDHGLIIEVLSQYLPRDRDSAL